ncbi:unnamed protein product [Brachionus calyciflorus]|uniref:Calpain catalytic domain-containing protein n=1 Tax=Brachionus calyciflorus TaxID=104777 RepID=A0A813WVX9_9BILA|nr:unnamed protein product [Brachionus calyciflorus]
MDIIPFKGQVYEELLSQYDENNLFEDPYFSASDRSLYFSRRAPAGIVWKRPNQVKRNAQFVVDGFDRCDMDQGSIGNCWFIAGVVGIMQSPKLFAKVVPSDQSFTDNYAGIFHFRFWQYGQWVDVVVDDRLPFWTNGQLVYANNKDQPNEYWTALLEKAYAKLNGCYEALEAGQTTDALIDMSGGLEESFDLTKLESQSQLWTILYQAYMRNSIMGCSITADASVREAKLSNGLVRGHAYTITKVATVECNGRCVQLLRIRNPWGNDVEWKGAWSDNSREWNMIDSETREELGIVKDHDGEFWMSYKDFLTNWHQVQICHLSVDCFSGEIEKANDIGCMSWRKLAMDCELSWKCSIYHSEWTVGKTAGGCGQPNQAKFWTNPQFLIKVNDVDRDDSEDMATVVIALMQKDSRIKRIKTKSESAEEFIQFKFYRIKDDVAIDDSKTTGLKLYSNQLDRIGSSGSYINSREVTKRFRVQPGYYLIIPSTYDADVNCEFLLRIFTEEDIEANSLDQDKHDLTEEESFFELDDTDTLFSSWDNFFKAAGGNSEETEDATEESTNNRQSVQEACNLM